MTTYREDDRPPLTRREIQARYRARKRGEDVLPVSNGRPGRKQSPEHVAKKAEAVRGERNGQWKGDEVGWTGGHIRARRLYPEIGPCSLCGSEPSERHHVDGNHANNEPENIAILCRRCHMTVDGRLNALRSQASRASRARWGKRESDAV